MAALYAGVNTDKAGDCTRLGNSHISTFAQTWDVQVTVDLDKDGHYSVRVRELGSGGSTGKELGRLDGQYPPQEVLDEREAYAQERKREQAKAARKGRKSA